jgi:hypothetical protein
MILRGNIGKLAIRILTGFSNFGRKFKVVRFGDTFKIFRSIPSDELKHIEITKSNILSFKFDVYEAFRFFERVYSTGKQT